MDDVILSAWHGGLGDSLQFSTLPEEFHKQQGRDTYILENAPFRNPEIYDLVWGENPYVKGKKSGIRNAGDIPEIPYQEWVAEGKGTGKAISNWELFHGLEPVNTYPKIYYEPEKHEGFDDAFIVDFSSISIGYDKNQLKNIFEDMKREYPDKKFLSVYFKNDLFVEKDVDNVKHNVYDIGFEGYVEIENIFKYCDLMTSSYGVLTLSSGASHLSSALQEYAPDLKSFCVMPEKWYNKHKKMGIFLFDNIQHLTY